MLLFTHAFVLAAGPGYSVIMEDLPLMPGMIEKADEAIVFDKPGGRIVETIAESSAEIKEIERFYVETLPALGWKASSSSRFTRDDEMLILTVEKKKGIASVHFVLTPNRKGK